MVCKNMYKNGKILKNHNLLTTKNVSIIINAFEGFDLKIEKVCDEGRMMKKLHVTRWCFVPQDAKVLIIDSTGRKMPAIFTKEDKVTAYNYEKYHSIEEYISKRDNSAWEEYDYIFVMADNTVWNSKGLLEWSRFVRNHVAADKQDDTEEVIKSLRSMGGRDCIYFKKKNNSFVWKKDVVVK